MEVLKTYNLFLDDIRSLEEAHSYTLFAPFIDEHWKIVRNYDQFVSFVKRNFERHKAFPKFVAFDHDLADEHYSNAMFTDPDKYDGYYDNKFVEKTGLECAKWLIGFCMDNGLEFPDYYVHSMNPVGRQNITSYIENYKKHCENE